jgi:hypothetical protein
MKIGLAYSYYNAAKETARALDFWYDHVDHIIAVDGRYKTPLSPEMKKHPMPDFSTDHTYHVLKSRYDDKLTHKKFFGTQMEKRQLTFEMADLLGCDILITWDSDDYIHPKYQNWNKFMIQLKAALKYWDDNLVFQMWAWIPSESLWPKQHNAVPSNHWMKYIRVHKNPGKQRYVLNHFTFTKKNITDEQINDWDYKHPNEPGLQALDNPYLLTPSIVLDGIRITTDRTLRTSAQLAYGDGWAWQNLHEENWRHMILPAVKRLGIKPYKENAEYYFNEQGERIVYDPDGLIKDPLIIQDGKAIKRR